MPHPFGGSLFRHYAGYLAALLTLALAFVLSLVFGGVSSGSLGISVGVISGARGNTSQLNQMAGMKGVVANPSGRAEPTLGAAHHPVGPGQDWQLVVRQLLDRALAVVLVPGASLRPMCLNQSARSGAWTRWFDISPSFLPIRTVMVRPCAPGRRSRSWTS